MIRTRLQGDTPFFPNMLNNGNVEVCLKEDVDKVLAQKDKEIAGLVKKNKQLARKDVIMASEAIKEVFKELHHQKYKRCLRNAESCMNKAWYYTETNDRNASNIMWKWNKRWLEIAEQFKDA